MALNCGLIMGCSVVVVGVEFLTVVAAITVGAVLVVPAGRAPCERVLCSHWLVLLDGLGCWWCGGGSVVSCYWPLAPAAGVPCSSFFIRSLTIARQICQELSDSPSGFVSSCCALARR